MTKLLERVREYKQLPKWVRQHPQSFNEEEMLFYNCLVITQALLEALEDGWVLVPGEATDKMCCVAYNSNLQRSISEGFFRHLWKAAIKAAPEHKVMKLIGEVDDD